MNFWNTISSTGVQYAQTASEKRSIYLSNAISVVVFALGTILFFIYYLWYGWSVVTYLIPVISTLTLVTLLLNYREHLILSRIWICLFLPVTTMALSIYGKREYYYSQQELDYFTFRIIILACCVFPPVFFSIKERFLLVSTSLAIFAILLLHDPLHEYFGVPYRPVNLKESNYTFTNFVIAMAYSLMTGAVFFMRWVSEVNEYRAQALIEELNQANQKLQDKNHEVEVRNEEIMNQTERLNVSRQKLTDAYKIIEEQRNLLYVQNKNLSSELIEKNKELTETNNELIKHNNELRQFSFTVSHNLRGPVASLMGLLKLFDPDHLTNENSEIFRHIETSTHRLDNIIKDLSKIIDIRHDIFHIRQQIDLETIIAEITEVLHREIDSHAITIHKSLQDLSIIYSVRPMVHSILYNLVSNAIKYRSPDRESIINISTREDDKYYFIEVADNGLGIDLNRDRDNLFKMYKRFHHHTEGRGLGLYLVKLQAEALGGSVHVDSEINKFTTFIVRLQKPENAERQVLYHEAHVEISFDAKLNCINTRWNKMTTPEQYRIANKKVLDFLNAYNTPNYLSQLSVETLASNEAIESNFNNFLLDASRNGLVRVAVVLPYHFPQYENENAKQQVKKYGISYESFHDVRDAIEWIELANERTAKKYSE